MLNFRDGRALAKISGGKYDGEILYLQTEKDKDKDSDSEDSPQKCCRCRKCSPKCKNNPCCKRCCMYGMFGEYFEIDDGMIIPLPKVEERSVDYIAGPSGSGKTTYAVQLAKVYKKIHPQKDFFLFSRTDYKNDPAFQEIRPYQIMIDDSIVQHPIDITKELSSGGLLLFDDCNTVQDDKQKKAIDKLMNDIMEVGRKLNITIIMTNHLVIPNERKVARTIMNEMQTFTFFPKSGSSQQIRYCLKTYFGLANKQIDKILMIPSRWITLHKNFPLCLLHEKGVFLI
jgi:hypothetical protein